MKALQVRLPEAIHRRAKELARDEGMSLNQFIVTSLSNEIVRQETLDFFRDAAAAFDPDAFAEALEAVPDVPPDESDRLP
ncbi:MAG: YlcI/YnfO family protein [Planctomycetota bacterium]